MTTTPPRRRRLRPTRVAAALFLLVLILEIMVIIAVGNLIGAWPTFFLLVATSALGFWLVRREGSKAWQALNQALLSGRMPAKELADGVVVLVGGALLLVPGFITDVVGLVLVLPVTRPVARRAVQALVGRHVVARTEIFTDRSVTGPPAAPEGPRRSTSSDEVVEGEVLDD